MGVFWDDKEIERTFLLSEYGKQKLIGYADSFLEMAKVLEPDEYLNTKQNLMSRQDLYLQKKIRENKDMLKENLECMSRVMIKVAGEVFSYRPYPERRARKISQALRLENIKIRNLSYIEDRETEAGLSMVLSTTRKGGIYTKEAADLLSVLLDMRLVPTAHCPYQIDREMRSFVFRKETKYHILTGVAKAVKEGETISGDNVISVTSDRGKVTLLLSDGMGSGEQACEDSELVLSLMEKLLEAGYSPMDAVTLINGVILTNGNDSHMSTLDICTINLYDGICEFLKIGAAASFIKRGDLVEQIKTGNLPLGVIPEINKESTMKRLQDGDYVFLLSDGILDALDTGDYENDVHEILKMLPQQNPKELAEVLLKTVVFRARGHITDDMTVFVLGIWENN